MYDHHHHWSYVNIICIFHKIFEFQTKQRYFEKENGLNHLHQFLMRSSAFNKKKYCLHNVKGEVWMNEQTNKWYYEFYYHFMKCAFTEIWKYNEQENVGFSLDSQTANLSDLNYYY